MLESSSNTTTNNTTTSINHSNVKRNNKENQTISDAMTIPLSNQNNTNNLANSSVIQQTNQQSVIQSTAVSAQILQSTRMDQTTDNNNNDNNTNVICTTAEDESKRRREMLNRRPSYRKILNDISSADTTGIMKLETERTNENQQQSQQSSSTSANTSQQHIVVSSSDSTVLSLAQPVTVNLSSQSNTQSATHLDQNNNDTIPLTQVGSYLKMIPTSTMQLASEQDLPATVQLTNHANVSSHQQINHHGIVQYASSNPENQQFYITDTLHTWPYRGDFPAYQLRNDPASPVRNQLNSSNVSTASSFQSSGSNNGQHREEEQDKKRQLRLQKNREAAKECRRKKKEYIKCLEDRVNVLAQQNKTLIEELKTLKKLYCQQANE